MVLTCLSVFKDLKVGHFYVDIVSDLISFDSHKTFFSYCLWMCARRLCVYTHIYSTYIRVQELHFVKSGLPQAVQSTEIFIEVHYGPLDKYNMSQQAESVFAVSRSCRNAWHHATVRWASDRRLSQGKGRTYCSPAQPWDSRLNLDTAHGDDTGKERKGLS